MYNFRVPRQRLFLSVFTFCQYSLHDRQEDLVVTPRSRSVRACSKVIPNQNRRTMVSRPAVDFAHGRSKSIW